MQFIGLEPLGPSLSAQRYQLANGLRVLLLEEHSAPVVAYHTWFRVGSRNESPGKTGLAHFFEHLMFNETESLAAGEYDRRMEALGADFNAATWLDWTQYTISVVQQALEEVVQLEAERMGHLVLGKEQLESEREVVINERRYRVEDDVEGAMNEKLWSTAFEHHPYRWPTIGWMEDIRGYCEADCKSFYQTFYAPNNATLVIVGDVTPERALPLLHDAYGGYASARLPPVELPSEPQQAAERRVVLERLTPTGKLSLGYHCPGFADADHPRLALLAEIVAGARSSRLVRRLVREEEVASDVRAHVSPLLDPGLFEVFVNVREGCGVDEALVAVNEELERVGSDGVSSAELQRAVAGLELGLLEGLSTAEGKASTLGLHEVLLGDPGAAFARLEKMRTVREEEIAKVARDYLKAARRTQIRVDASAAEARP